MGKLILLVGGGIFLVIVGTYVSVIMFMPHSPIAVVDEVVSESLLTTRTLSTGATFSIPLGPQGFTPVETSVSLLRPGMIEEVTFTHTPLFLAAREAAAAREGPPVMSIAVYERGLVQDLSEWLEVNNDVSLVTLPHSAPATTTIDRVEALTYDVDGLYTIAVTAFMYEDFIYVVRSDLHDDERPTRRDVTDVLASWTFPTRATSTAVTFSGVLEAVTEGCQTSVREGCSVTVGGNVIRLISPEQVDIEGGVAGLADRIGTLLTVTARDDGDEFVISTTEHRLGTSKYLTVPSRISERIPTQNGYLTVLSVVEDSRCPQSVACIQAGTVRVRVKYEHGTLVEERTMNLGQAINVASETLTLTHVVPAIDKPETVLSTEMYLFLWEILAKTN